MAQYCLVIGFFLLRQGRGQHYSDISGEVSLKKWSAYQRSDLMHSMIEQMPVVMQFFFAGAFEAGVVSVVLLVKKLRKRKPVKSAKRKVEESPKEKEE